MNAYAKSLMSLALATAILSACAARRNSEVDDLFDHPLKYDGRVVEMVIYPADGGYPTQYRFCWERCSIEIAGAKRLGIGYWPTSYIIPCVRGEFDGWDGERPVRVRARFDARCWKPNAWCVDIAFYWFYEVE